MDLSDEDVLVAILKFGDEVKYIVPYLDDLLLADKYDFDDRALDARMALRGLLNDNSIFIGIGGCSVCSTDFYNENRKINYRELKTFLEGCK